MLASILFKVLIVALELTLTTGGAAVSAVPELPHRGISRFRCGRGCQQPCCGENVHNAYIS